MTLEDIELGVSPLTNTIYMGKTSKKNPEVWNLKRDCTASFLSALMTWCPPGDKRVITRGDGQMFTIRITYRPGVLDDDSQAIIDNFVKAFTRSHYCCDEDSWYSCPKHPEGCGDDNAGSDCNCGADAWNENVKAFAGSLELLLTR